MAKLFSEVSGQVVTVFAPDSYLDVAPIKLVPTFSLPFCGSWNDPPAGLAKVSGPDNYRD